MTFRLSGPYTYFFDTDGSPLAAGSVYFYEAGTATPKDTYTDSAQTATNTNPVVLDGEGKAQIALDGDYKMIVKDSAGVTVWTADNITTPPTTAEVTATIQAALSIPTYSTLAVAATATIDATVKRVFVEAYATQTAYGSGAYYKRVDSQPGHALRFRSIDRYISDGTTSASNGGWWEIEVSELDARQAGLLADGLTASASTNASALALCEDWLADKGGGVLHLPPGTIHTNAAFLLNTTSNVELVANGTVLDFAQATTTSGIVITSATDITISGDLTIQNADVHGIYVTGAASGITLDRVHCTANGQDGLRFDGGSHIALRRCRASSNTGDGLAFEGTAAQHDGIAIEEFLADSNTAQGITLANVRGLAGKTVRVDGNGSHGLHASNCDGFVIDSLITTGNTGSGIDLDGTDALNTTHAVDNFRGRFSGVVASSNAAGAMTMDATVTGSATVDVEITDSNDTGATASVASSGAGATVLGENNSWSGTIPVSLQYPKGQKFHGTETSFGTGTSVAYTGLPADLVQLMITVEDMSNDDVAGTDEIMLQIGDAGGIETTGYKGAGINPTASTGNTSTSGWVITSGNTAGLALNGTLTLTLKDPANNTWALDGVLTDDASGIMMICSGAKSLSAELTQFQFTTTGGTDLFDGGDFTPVFERG